MTDIKKPVWTRCIGCKQRVYNDPIDVEAHKPLCPAELARKIRNLRSDLGRATERLDKLEKQPVAEPLDLDELAPWDADPTDSDPHDEEDEEPVQRSVYANDGLYETDPTPAHDDEDPDDVRPAHPYSGLYTPNRTDPDA